MSKRRENPPMIDSDAALAPSGDLAPYVIFTQLKPGGPFLYAGWLDAADEEMAMQFAREHYGQDQECINIWAIPRNAITSSDGLFVSANQANAVYSIFTQKRAGDPWISAGEVEASGGREAIASARQEIAQARRAATIWAVPRDWIIASDPQALIWRYTDQSYRLARGYSRDVREKWSAIRDEQKLAEYERDDLAESF